MPQVEISLPADAMEARKVVLGCARGLLSGSVMVVERVVDR
jgi:hypothetical protein